MNNGLSFNYKILPNLNLLYSYDLDKEGLDVS